VNNLQKWIGITAWLDLIYFFLIPYLMLINGLAWPVAILAGISLGSFQPTVTSYHELHHRKKTMKWFEKIPFYFGFASYLLGVIDVVHQHFHHKHANTEKDISHPMAHMNYYQNTFNYYVRYFYKTFFLKPKQVGFSLLGFVALGFIQVHFFGWPGLAFQVSTVLAHHWTVSCGNYCQHYGLEKLNLPDNEKAKHAWDNKGEFAKYSFFNFHRHSGHHANAGKPAEQIIDNSEMLRNPYPLPLMMFISLFPPLFKKVVAYRLQRHLLRFIK